MKPRAIIDQARQIAAATVSPFTTLPRAFWLAVCNLFGLAANLAGFLVLFVWVLPAQPPQLFPQMITSDAMHGYEDQLSTYKLQIRLGAACVVAGTVLQGVPIVWAITFRGRRRRNVSEPKNETNRITDRD